VTSRVNDYGPRNRAVRAQSIFGTVGAHRRGIAFAFAATVKMLLASIALSALVLWALGCSGPYV
jgi:hypothetical protein